MQAGTLQLVARKRQEVAWTDCVADGNAGDPGVGIFLVPLGAAMLFVAVALTAWGTGDDSRGSKEGPDVRS